MNGDALRNRTGDVGKNVRANGASGLLNVEFLMIPEKILVDVILADDYCAKSIVVVSRIFVAKPNCKFES